MESISQPDVLSRIPWHQSVRKAPLMSLLDLQMLLKDRADLDLERAHTYHHICEMVEQQQVEETEWVVVNMREMTSLHCVSQTCV
jgi:hypothetical protein